MMDYFIFIWLLLILFLIINIVYLEINNLNNYEKIIQFNIKNLDSVKFILFAQLKNNIICKIDIDNTLIITEIINNFNNGINYYTFKKQKYLCVQPIIYKQIIFDKLYLHILFGIIILIILILIYCIFYSLYIKLFEKKKIHLNQNNIII